MIGLGIETIRRADNRFTVPLIIIQQEFMILFEPSKLLMSYPSLFDVILRGIGQSMISYMDLAVN
jgi:hypothetical protein